MSDKDEIPADKLTKAYIKIRAERAALSAEFKERDGALVRQQTILKNALLDYCETHKVESVRTSEDCFLERLKQNTGRAIGNVCTSLYLSMTYPNCWTNV